MDDKITPAEKQEITPAQAVEAGLAAINKALPFVKNPHARMVLRIASASLPAVVAVLEELDMERK